MKSEDLERLKKLLKGTEFQIENTYIDYAFVAVNEWKGVDFVECKTDRSDIFKRGKVYRLVPEKDIEGKDCIYDSENIEGSAYGFGGTKKNFKPSTEEAYFDQLKAKAFELYGEIKDGDFFQDWGGVKFEIDDTAFKYKKEMDALYLGIWVIYFKGQWAKKLHKRITILELGINFNNNEAAYKKAMLIGKETVNEYMTKKLEKLLNDEVE